MPKYNRNFELSVEDLDLIEQALRASKAQALNDELAARAANDNAETNVRRIHDLLGRLHNQKTFYRPSKGYVSG